MIESFEIAPMDGPIRTVTYLLLILPITVLAVSLTFIKLMLLLVIFLLAIYVWIWIWFRPTRFEVSPDALTIVWPVRTRRLERADITGVTLITRAELRERIGWSIRVGSGGIWGGFGWLYTSCGWVRMYISRIDRVVWFDTAQGMPWIITPDQPEEFVSAMSRQ